MEAERQQENRAKRLLQRRSARLVAGFLFLWPFLAWVAAQGVISHRALQRADVIVVLAGSATFVEAAREAAKVFHEGRAPKILLTDDALQSGWSDVEQRNPFFSEKAKAELLQQGVPPDAIEVLSPAVRSTHEEALLMRKILPERNAKAVLIVTSPYHTRRALRYIEKALSDSKIEVGIVSPPVGQQSPTAFTWWLTWKGWQLVGGEYVKLFYYWLVY